MEKAAKEAELTLERVLRELAKVGYSDIRKVVNWQELGPVAAETTAEERLNGAAVTLVDSATIDAATAAAISEISQTKDGTIRVKMHPKLPALTALLAYLREVEVNKPPPENKPAPTVKQLIPDWPALRRMYGLT